LATTLLQFKKREIQLAGEVSGFGVTVETGSLDNNARHSLYRFKFKEVTLTDAPKTCQG
jgi:hypothetical protein